jgi:hypothetical protein
MATPMTKTGANLRLMLYIAIAIVTYLVGDEYLREVAPASVLTSLKAAAAGLVAWRAVIDSSNADAQKADAAPQPVEVVNTADSPVPTEESGLNDVVGDVLEDTRDDLMEQVKDVAAQAAIRAVAKPKRTAVKVTK